MRQIQAPSKYMQGPNLLDDLAKHVKDLADNFLILSGNTAMETKKDVIEKSFSKEGIACKFEKFNGETSYKEIDRLADIIEKGKFTAMIGLGGGKVMDTAKAAANKVGIPVVMAPTVAASDAPCSSVSVVYNEDGTVNGVEYFKTNPELVLVDTDMVAKAPSRFLIAGIGDALSTYFEASICHNNNYKNVLGSEVSETALGLAKLSYELILKYAYQAKLAVDMNIVSNALENIVEANTYLSGVGFESGGISCSHSIQDALTEIPECSKFLHGERVAFGTLCLLILEDFPKEMVDEFLELCASIGLPITLSQLDLKENVEEKIKGVMDIAYQPEEDSVYNMPPKATKESMYAAILLADKIGSEFLE